MDNVIGFQHSQSINLLFNTTVHEIIKKQIILECIPVSMETNQLKASGT